MQTLINSIIARINELADFRYVARNWNQLSYEQPPVQFPCALVDITSVNYSQLAHGSYRADATITVTIADQQLARDAVDHFLDVVNTLIEHLNLFYTDFLEQPLTLNAFSRSYSDKSYDVYTLTFTTSWSINIPKAATSKAPNAFRISI